MSRHHNFDHDLQNVQDFGAAMFRAMACPACGAPEAHGVQLLDPETGAARCRHCGLRFIQPQRKPFRSDWRRAYPELVQ